MNGLHPVDLNRKLACFTLDFEGDRWWAGHTRCEMLEQPALFARFQHLIEVYNIKLTVFVVGKMFETHPEYIDRLAGLGATFELHSYSHDTTMPDSETEIQLAKQAYYKFFSCNPRGYRAPIGLISNQGLQTLREEGFIYDASVLPSRRFDEFGFNHLDKPTTPWIYDPGTSPFVELPFGVIPKIRLPISLSYLKLLGWPLYRTLLHMFGLPRALVFNSHPYDYFLTDAVREWPNWKRYVHLRNINRSIQILTQFLELLQKQGYEFISMQELYDRVCQQAGLNLASDNSDTVRS
ncbi:MAG: polysaccharide deacetylase family protein [Anaerolineae bacterium]|nr:polysaccharide deacetylase family protein [Anaerolineae bacterium]